MICHIWSAYQPSDPDSIRRHLLAQATWERQPWTERPILDSELPRMFDENGKKIPFIGDLFDYGAAGTTAEDILVFSNSDIGFATNAALRITFALQANDAGYAFRRDAHHRVLCAPTDSEIGTWNDYPGNDVFFFRQRWWRQHRTIFPDMLLAREAWDACMRVLVEATNPHKPLSLPNLVWHERHPNGWENAAVRYAIPGQLHNLSLARVFLAKMGHNPAAFGIR